MGWPRKDDELRIYADKQEPGAYFMLLTCNGQTHRGGYEAIANVHPGPQPSLCYTSIGPAYFTRTWPKRVEWSELPSEWQEAFRTYMSQGEDEPFDPARYRGLWRVGNQPRPQATPTGT